MPKDSKDSTEDTAEVLPDAITDFSDDQIVTHIDTLAAQFDAIHAGELTNDDLGTLEKIVDDIEALRTEQSARTVSAEETAAKAAKLADRIRPTEPETEEVTEEAAVEAEETEPKGDAIPAEPDGVPVELPAEEPAEPELVAASARPRTLNISLSDAAKHSKPAAKASSAPTITDMATGGPVTSRTAAAKLVADRFRTLPANSGRVAALKIRRDYDHVIDATTSTSDVPSIVAAATDPRDSLIAAGGWCAPSENLYTFFDVSAADGLIDIPTVGTDRGGLNIPGSSQISDYTANTFVWTEANDIDEGNDNPTKPCIEIACPDWTDVRMDAMGICANVSNLQNAALPEQTEHVIGLALNAHEHAMSARVIDDITAGSTAVTGTSAPNGLTAPVLNFIELQVIDIRLRLRMADSATIEVVLPAWAKGAIRADLARQGGVDQLAVSDAQIADWFATRHAAVQYVQDWQNASVGGSTPAVAWPQILQFLAYPAGTWLKLGGFDLTLETQRDSTLNSTNMLNRLFTEQGIATAKVGPLSRVGYVDICASGEIGNRVSVTCPTV